jgi:hypothetical protein
VIAGKYAIFGFAKVGRRGNPGAMVESQGCFLRSDNILIERDPRKLGWELLPDGDEGLRAPKGSVSDEANPVVMNEARCTPPIAQSTATTPRPSVATVGTRGRLPHTRLLAGRAAD